MAIWLLEGPKYGLFFKTYLKQFHIGHDQHKYTFNNMIETDGVSCSIILILRKLKHTGLRNVSLVYIGLSVFIANLYLLKICSSWMKIRTRTFFYFINVCNISTILYRLKTINLLEKGIYMRYLARSVITTQQRQLLELTQVSKIFYFVYLEKVRTN